MNIKKYISLLNRFRWFVAVGFPLMVLLLSMGLKNLKFDGSYRIWFGEGSKTLNSYDKFQEDFGNDDALVVIIHDPKGIFTKKRLKTIDNIAQKLWDIEYISKVNSIINYQYIYTDKDRPDEVVVEDFFDDLDDLNETFIKEREKIALNDPVIVDSFISKDGKTTMISARLLPKINDKSDKSIEIMNKAESLLKDELKSGEYEIYLNGGPALNKAFIDIATYDASTFTPIVIILAMLMLFLLFKRVSGMMLPIAVVVMTFVSVLSVQVMLGFKLNNFTANLPVFIIAIGIADAVHIYSVWLMSRREGKNTYEATTVSLEKNLLPVFLTSLTTALGFATLMVSKVVPVFTLGIATASAAILAFVISVVWMPSVLLLLKKEIKKPKEIKSSQLFKNYGRFITTHAKSIVILTSIIFAILGAGLFKVKIDSNTIRYFDKDVPMRKATEFIMKELTGPMAYEIIADSGKKDGIKDPQFLKTVERFYKDFQSKFKDARHLYSLMDIVKRFNKVLNHKDEIPNSSDLIAQYLLLYSMSIPQEMSITDKMDIDERRLRITAQMNIVDTSQDLKMLRYIKDWWSKTPYSAKVEGQTAMFAHMQKDVTNTLIYSLSLAIVLVSIVMLFIFRDLKLLWIFILPNLLPVVLVVGVMGWLGINIDIGVAISGAIIIGVAVDDTIHFLVKFFEARKKGLDLKQSFDEVIRYAGKAIIFTTAVLSVSFSVFVFSDFKPDFNFGVVTAIALVVALVIDLLLLPALLSLSRKI
jgi:hydrophobe/amphiphile efflux-3 (HAE3) family protein